MPVYECTDADFAQVSVDVHKIVRTLHIMRRIYEEVNRVSEVNFRSRYASIRMGMEAAIGVGEAALRNLRGDDKRPWLSGPEGVEEIRRNFRDNVTNQAQRERTPPRFIAQLIVEAAKLQMAAAENIFEEQRQRLEGFLKDTINVARALDRRWNDDPAAR